MYYDIAVLGAGTGGYVCAIRAAQLGAKVAIIEKENVGGTCLNAGCIPTKALIKNVEILHSIELGKQRGIKAQGIELDYKKAVNVKNHAVEQLVYGIEGLLSSNGIDLYRGNGRIEVGQMISIESEQNTFEKIEYGKLIIATGSSPAIPPIKGAASEGVVTSTELLQIETVPEHLVIIGGGVIGCEFASIFQAYGSHVSIIEMLPSLVSTMDEEISYYMGEMMTGLDVDLKLGMQVKEIAKQENGMLDVLIANSQGREEILSGDLVLISAGRKPNLEGLELLNLVTLKRYIEINDKLETSTDNVYAIGDVTGKKMLAHVASEMGIFAAENAMGACKKIDLDIVPSCIYTIPEIGSVGLTEAEAIAKGHNLIIGRFPLIACGKAVTTGETDGIFKIIADGQTRKLLGAHLIGKSATELVAEVAAYIKMNAGIDDVVDTIHAHPTFSEAIAEAARDADGCCIHMPKK